VAHVNSPSVKAAQPPFLGLMLLGAAVLYCVMIVWTFYMTDGLCVARSWLLSIGFVILYGTLVARVHRVNFTLAGARELKAPRVIPNRTLFMIIGILVGIDVIILIVWTALNPHQLTTVYPDPLRASKNQLTCSISVVDIVFIIILAVYKLMIVGYGIFLSIVLWRSRSIFIESRKVIFCFYNLALFAIIWVVLQNALSDPSLLYVFRSACIFISVFSTTITLFVPRMISPNKTSSSASGSNSSMHAPGELGVNGASTQAVIDGLQKKIQELQSELDHYKNPQDSSKTEPEDEEELKKKARAATMLAGTPTVTPTQNLEDSSETEE